MQDRRKDYSRLTLLQVFLKHYTISRLFFFLVLMLNKIRKESNIHRAREELKDTSGRIFIVISNIIIP